MIVAVAGGTGFVGRYISQALIENGHEVTVLSRDPRKVARVPQLQGARAARADVTDPRSLEGTLEGVEAVIGVVQFPNYPMEQAGKGLTFDRYDRQGTEHLLVEAKRAGVSRFVYLSGAGADASSDRSWYRAKGVAEAVVRSSGLTWAIVRPSWAYGPEDRALNRFVLLARLSPVVPYLSKLQMTGSRPTLAPQVIQPIHVADIGLAIARLFENEDAWERVLEIGGEVMTMRQVLETMISVMGKRRLLIPVPEIFARLGTAPLLALPKPPLSPGGVAFAVQDAIVDTTEADKVLELQPRPLAAGLSEYLAS